MVDHSTQDNRTVLNYLKRGQTGGLDPDPLAALCDRYVRARTQVSAVEAVDLGRRFVELTRPVKGAPYKTALLAYAWALRMAGAFAEARRIYLTAKSLCRGDDLARARIDRVLIDVYMYLGKYREAERRARLANATFSRLRRTDDLAKTRVNLANVYHRQDRHRDAHAMYHRAAAHFQRRSDLPAAALCWCNEANTLVQLFRFDDARELYQRSRQIFTDHDQQLYAAACLYGLAWLNMLAGDFHTALQQLAECEEIYVAGHQPRELLLCQLDRAESYLGLNLFVDARASAETAETHARTLGLDYETAKAALFQGKAAIGLGRLAEARRCLQRATAGFRRVHNDGFRAATELTRATIDRSRSAGRRRCETAGRLFHKAQLPLWEAICDFQTLTAWPDDDLPLKRLTANPATRVVPHLSARKFTFLGDREAARRRLGRAVHYWTRAAEILDGVRAKLPPVEMRAAYFAHRADPFRKLIATQSGRDTEQAAIWSERFKTTGVWATSSELAGDNPARARIKDSLEKLTNQVAMACGAPGGESGRRSALTRRLSRKGRQLEARIRNDFGSLTSDPRTSRETNETIAAQLRSVSRTMPIVQFHAGDADVYAFVHEAGGVRCHVFRDGVRTARELVARWRYLVECALGDRAVPRTADTDEEPRLLRRMGQWLLPPLELPEGSRRLLIVPDGPLFSLPWLALDRHGRPLSEHYQIVLAPTVRHHTHARKQLTRSRQAKIFVGQGYGLPYVEREVGTLVDRLSAFEVALFNPGRRDDWPDDSASQLWHFAGHAHLRADNPFYSSLQMTDGAMFAADFRLKSNRVNLVTLAACRTGQNTSLPGKEASGLVRSLIEMGARNVVAANWAVSDRSTAMWMDAFYKYYLDGNSVAAAGRSAALALREVLPSACHWGSFSVHGAG